MTTPLRLAAMQITPQEVEEICRSVESTGGLVEVRPVDRPEELAGIRREEADVVVACHAPPDQDAGRWLGLLRLGAAPPLIIISETIDPEEAIGLRQSGAFAVVPRGHSQCLALAIRLAATWSSSVSVAVSEARSEREGLGPTDRRRMAGLMGSIGHNLRDLLGGISNAVEVLAFQSDEASLSQRRTIELLDRQCRRMAGLLDDYSEIARMESDRPEPRREVAELGAVLDRAIDRTRIEVAEGTIFERPSHPEPLWLSIDARRLEQLVRHALLYVRRVCPGCRTIRLDWREEADRLELVVDPVSVARPGASAGIGAGRAVDLDLFLAATLAERLGGRVRPGLPFVVELPRSSASPPMVGAGSGQVHSAGGRPGAGRYVMLVDDNPDSVQGLAMLIGRLGWHVRVTPDIDEALEMVRSHRPRVVLIDLNMPVIDGQTLARRIRREAPVDTPMLIGISGSTDRPPSEESAVPAFDYFLLKPVRREQIAALLPSEGQRVL